MNKLINKYYKTIKLLRFYEDNNQLNINAKNIIIEKLYKKIRKVEKKLSKGVKHEI